MASPFQRLKEGLSRAYDQVNILDGGRSWQNRKPNNRDSSVRQLRDVFDSNSARDQQRRVAQNQPRMYRDQQIAMGNKRPIENLGGQIIGNSARFLNTAQYAGTALADTISGDLDRQRRTRERFGRPNSGLLGMGTIYNNSDEMMNLGNAEIIKRVGLNTLGTASEVLPFARVARPIGIGAKAGTQLYRGAPVISNATRTGKVIKIANNAERGVSGLKARVAFNAGMDTATGAGESVARQYATTGKIDPKVLLGDTAASLALGQAQLLPAYGKAIKNSDSGIKASVKVKPLGTVSDDVQGDSVYKALEKKIDTTVQRMSKATGKLKENYRQEALEYIRQRNARVSELSQGGYIHIGSDGKKHVKVTKDQHLFDNVKPEQYPKIVSDYMNKNFRGRNIKVDDGGNVSFTNKGNRKYANSGDPLDPQIFDAKMRLGTEADIAVEISQYAGNLPDKGGRHGNYAKDGFDYRTFEFEVKGQRYRGTINIAKNGEIQKFYDIKPIKKSSDAGLSTSRTPVKMSDDGTSIPINNKPVNPIKGLENYSQPTPPVGKNTNNLQDGQVYNSPQKFQNPQSQASLVRKQVEILPQSQSGSQLVGPTERPLQIGETVSSTSSNSSLATSPELFDSAPRIPDQKATLQVQQNKGIETYKTPPQKIQDQRTYLNATPKTTKVKLNTDRLNINKAEKLELDKQTAEVIESISNKDISKIAKDAGIDTKTHSTEQIKKKIAEQLNVRQDAVRYAKEAEIARKAGNLDLAEQSMLKSAEAGRISRAQGSEAAQVLQARRIIANELDTPQQRIFKLLDAAGVNPEAYVNRLRSVDFTDAKQVVEAYRDLVPAKAGEWLDTLRYNSMLSSPLTQAVNVFGNAQGVLGVAPIEKTVRGTMDAIAGAFGKERQYAAGEGLAYAKGAVTNITNATRNFRDALSGNGKYANPDFQDYNIPLATKGISGAAFKTLSFPMRVLDGMDKFFRTLAEGGEDSALDLRASKGIDIKGNRQALKEQEASYRVFQQELKEPGQGVLNNAADEFASFVMSGRNSKNPIVSGISKFTVPFVKTINNINKQGIVDYSPLGFVNTIGNTDKVTAITRATMGSAMFGISGMMIGSGNMTWAEPRDPEERARFRAEGKQPYAIRIGGKWFNFSKLHPSVSFPMAMSAAIDDAMKEGDIDQSKADQILEAFAKYGNFMSDQSYAKSIGDTLGAIGGDKEAAARIFSNYTQQVIPFRALTGWVARMTDDVERKVDTTQGYIDQQVQQLMQQYPGLRQKTPTRDYKGEPIPANNPVLNAFSPVRITDDRGTSASDAALDAIKLATETDPLLDKRQTAEIDKLVADKLYKAQDKLLADPKFQALSDEDKKAKISKLSTDIRAVERRMYMSDNSVGEYAPGFAEEGKKLTKDQQQLIKTGEVDNSRYIRATDAPDLPDNINSKARTILEDENASDAEWLKQANTDTEIASTMSSWLGNKVKMPPITNAIAKEWATFEKNKAEGTIGKLEDEAQRRTILKSAFNSQLNEDEKDLHSLSEEDLIDAHDRGLITDENIDRALAVEKQLYDAGLIDKESLARKLDLNARGYKGKKGKKGSKGKDAKNISIAKSSGTADLLAKTIAIKKGSSKSKGVKINPNAIIAKSKVQIKKK